VSPTGGVAIASSVMEADPSTVTPHPSPEISTIIEKKKKKGIKEPETITQFVTI
jgi:hypothetical protein